MITSFVVDIPFVFDAGTKKNARSELFVKNKCQ